MLLDSRGRGRCGRARRTYHRTRSQQLDLRSNDSSQSNSNNHHSHHHHHHHHHQNHQRNPHNTNGNSSNNHNSRNNQNGNNNDDETPTSPNTQTPDSSRTSTLTNGRPVNTNTTLPDNFNRFRMGSINWGLWACFIVVTVLLIPVHIYLKQYDYRGELMGIFFVITLLFLVCFSVSMFHTKTRAILLHRLHLEEDIRTCPMDMDGPSPSSRRRYPILRVPLSSQSRLVRHLALRPIRVSRSTPDLLVNGQLVPSSRVAQVSSPNHVSRSMSQVSHNSIFSGGHLSDSRSDSSPIIDDSEDPPPYHEAILLPAPSETALNRTCETPPPAYEIVK